MTVEDIVSPGPAATHPQNIAAQPAAALSDTGDDNPPSFFAANALFIAEERAAHGESIDVDQFVGIQQISVNV